MSNTAMRAAGHTRSCSKLRAIEQQRESVREHTGGNGFDGGGSYRDRDGPGGEEVEITFFVVEYVKLPPGVSPESGEGRRHMATVIRDLALDKLQADNFGTREDDLVWDRDGVLDETDAILVESNRGRYVDAVKALLRYAKTGDESLREEAVALGEKVMAGRHE
jgi:hypothetical protein